MKFIHCADFHLDSKQETNLSPQKAKQRNLELCLTFERIAEYASKNEVTAVMICGDLFDTARVTQNTIQFILDVISRNNTVDFLYLRGNHDDKHIFSTIKSPPNLKLFSEQWTQYHYNQVAITGIEITAENAHSFYSSLSLPSDQINIVMMHGQISGSPQQDSIVISRLMHKNIDYLALGHLHTYQKAKLDERGTYCYCGCPEGRGFDECGAKGFILIDIGTHTVHSSFVPFALRTLHRITIEVAETDNSASLLSKMRNASAKIPDRDIIKFSLKGKSSIYSNLNLNFLEKLLDVDFFTVKIDNQIDLQIDSRTWEQTLSLEKEFIQSVMNDPDLTEFERNTILRLGIQSLNNTEIMI